jgi:hypothetical protein
MNRFLIVLCVMVSAVFAQNEQQREAARQARIQDAKTFLDSSQPRKARLEAADRMGQPDPAVLPDLLKVVGNKAEDDDIRTAAARAHRRSPEYIATVVRILKDPADGGETFKANLIADLARRSISRLPPDQNREVVAAVRGVLDDARAPVRLAAYRALVPSEDPVATEKLASSLEKPDDVPIPLVEAIDLLDAGGPMSHVSVLRPFLDHRDVSVRASAARALAADSESRAKIVGMVRDKQAPESVRVEALSGLARVDDALLTYAIPLVEDASDRAPVRISALKAVVGRMNYRPPAAADQVRAADAIERFAGEPSRGAPNAELDKARAEAAQALRNFEQSLPAVRDRKARR